MIFPKGVSEIETLGQIYLEMAEKKDLAEKKLIKIREADSVTKGDCE